MTSRRIKSPAPRLLCNRLFWLTSKKTSISPLLFFVMGIHRWLVVSHHKGSVTWKGWHHHCDLFYTKPLPSPMLTCHLEWSIGPFGINSEISILDLSVDMSIGATNWTPRNTFVAFQSICIFFKKMSSKLSSFFVHYGLQFAVVRSWRRLIRHSFWNK